MLRILSCLFVAVATASVSNLAHAEEDFARSGCYLGLGGAYALSIRGEDQLEDEAQRIFGTSNADYGDTLGLNARGGCRGSWGGGELHFDWNEGFDTTVAGQDFEIETWSFTLDGKIYPVQAVHALLDYFETGVGPWPNRVQPFLITGFGYQDFDNKKLRDFLSRASIGNNVFPPEGFEDWDFIVRLGGGLEVYATKNIAISIDATYVLPLSNDMHDLDYVTIGWGFLYRF
jgi:opacity protein-like surface antigen